MEERKGQSENIIMNEEQFELLYRRYYFRLHNFAMQFTSDDCLAEDLVHEVFLKFWEGRDGFREYEAGALLFRMTRNLCLNHVKHIKVVQNKQVDLKKIRNWEELYRIEFIRDEPYILIEKELQEKVAEIMDALPEKCRQVFSMSRIDELKNSEIAQQLGISVKAVEKHINRALKDFREFLPVAVPISAIELIIKHLV